jgi:hypothetical protein
LTNNNPSETYIEYYFNTITLIEDVVTAFHDVIQHERNIKNFFKIIHDSGKCIEEIYRVDNHDDITYTHATTLVDDSGLYRLPKIIN